MSRSAVRVRSSALLFLANSDGCGTVNLTASPNSYDYGPDWGSSAPGSDVTVPDDVCATDESAPTSSATARDMFGNGYTPGTWASRDLTVGLSADDGAGSGVKEIYYFVNGGANQTYASADKIVVTSEGATTISYFATDYAGNNESPAQTFTVKIDKTAPTLDIDGSDGITPNNKQKAVRRNVEPRATFSDEMNQDSLGTAAKLYQWNAERTAWWTVPAAVSVEGKTATLDPYPTDPTRLLAANKRFRVTVTTEAKNLAGLALPTYKSWTFRAGDR